MAIAVNEDGSREVLGAAEGMREDKASWVSFFQWPCWGQLVGQANYGLRVLPEKMQQKAPDTIASRT